MLTAFFENEQRRGVFGFLGSTIIGNILNVYLTKYSKLNVQQSTFISFYIIGNIILYSCDILFAKKDFFVNDRYGPVSYRDLKTRFLWLTQSFYQKYFFRFLITVFLDTIIGLSILKYVIYKLDEYKVLTQWKYRNLIVAAIIMPFTYFLYLSTLRFRWAYEYKENQIMNILVMIWLSLALLITVDEKVISGKQPENSSLKNLLTS